MGVAMKMGWRTGKRIQKTINKCHEINKISTLTSSKNSSENAINVKIFLMSFLTICANTEGKGWVGLLTPMRGVLPASLHDCTFKTIV